MMKVSISGAVATLREKAHEMAANILTQKQQWGWGVGGGCHSLLRLRSVCQGAGFDVASSENV